MQFGMGPASGYDIRWLTRVDDATSTTYTYGYVCIMGKIPCYGNRLSRGCLGKGHEGRQDMRAWLSIDDPGAARYRSPLNERIPKKKRGTLVLVEAIPWARWVTAGQVTCTHNAQVRRAQHAYIVTQKPTRVREPSAHPAVLILPTRRARA